MKKIMFLLLGVFAFFSCDQDDYETFPSPGRQIKSFTLENGQFGNSVIRSRENDYTVSVSVLPNVDLTSIVPNIQISDKATIEPASGEPVDISQNRELIYTVTAASGQQREWKVIFEVLENTVEDYGVYLISRDADNALDVEGDITWNEKFWDYAKIGLSSTNSFEDIKNWQKWHIIYHSTTEEGKIYKIRNVFSGKYLAVPEDFNQSGGQLEQIGYSPDDENIDHKLWLLTEDDSGYGFQITNMANGMTLTSIATEEDDFSASLSSESNSESQRWLITPLEAESYRDDKVVNFFERNENWMGSVAFDQGNSVPLTWGPNAGKVLWITQDAWDGRSLTEDDRFVCGHFFSYNNSMFLQSSQDNWNPSDAVNITNPDNPDRPRQIAPNQPGTNRTWTGAAVEIGDKVYSYTGEGNGLESTGGSLYVLTQKEGTAWGVERLEPEGALGSSGMVKGDDGYVYSYTTKSLFGYDSSLYVARFPEDDPMSWTFWNGSDWGDVPPELDSPGKVTSTLGSTGVSKLNGKYIVMTMEQGYNCDENRGAVYLATSDSPTGPFTERKKVYQITEYLKGQYARYYTPIIHPWADNGKQELLLTYSLNFEACGQGSCEEGFMNPYYYRLKSIRVPYEMIGL